MDPGFSWSRFFSNLLKPPCGRQLVSSLDSLCYHLTAAGVCIFVTVLLFIPFLMFSLKISASLAVRDAELETSMNVQPVEDEGKPEPEGPLMSEENKKLMEKEIGEDQQSNQ